MAASTKEVVALLASVPVFETLGPAELERVAAVAVPRSFPAQHVIFREGDASDTCYVVWSGHARAIREHADGRVIALAHFGPGDIFGELAMFDDEVRSATVDTLDALEAIAILGGDMRRLLREHPDLAVKLSSRSAGGCGRPTSGSRASRSRPFRAASPRCSASSSSRRVRRAPGTATCW